MRTAVDLVWTAAPRELTLTLTLAAVGAVLTAAELLVGRHLVERLTTPDPGTLSDLAPWLVALGLLLVGTAIVAAATAELRILLNDLVHRQAMDQVLAAATAAELEDFEDPAFHDEVLRAREHADTYAWQVVWGLVTVAGTLLTIAAVVTVLLSVAPLLVPVAALAYVPIAVVGVRNTRALYRLRYGLAEMDRDRAYHERLLTGRLEAKEVRAFGLADWLRRRHDRLFEERIDHTRRVVAHRTRLALAGASLTALITVVALGVVLALALDGHIGVADAAVAVVALHQISGRLRTLGSAGTSMVEGVTFLRDFEQFQLRAASRRSAQPLPATLPVAPATVTLERVGYRYPTGSGPVLADVNLTLRPGEVVAVVGPNGAGKSTLAKLLCGLYAPTEGHIRWDEVDTASADPMRLRARVAPVFQDFARFEHSAAEAIAFGDLTRMDDTGAIRRAARRAGADEFLAPLPAGYQTRLSTAFSGGTDLSVGQWQRVAIARAFFRDAPLVVMDEPAASLDARSERDLFERLHDLGRDRMVVFISHRFATVREADRILVLVEGRVAEEGHHDELMAAHGLYAELYTLQAEQYA